MGGCYESSYSYRSSACSEPQWKTSMADGLKSFFRTKDVGDLVKAYVAFHESNSSGFIKQLLAHQNSAEASKEFPELEYELKLAVVPLPPKKSVEEPSIDQYLDAFEFPAARNARFLKDAINTNAEGRNHFFGRADEERLVVIEKGGKFYLKEKSSPLPVDTGVPYEQLVMKRTERRYEASMDEILKKVAAESHGGSEYQGVIRKEKGDAFVLGTYDGRIFSFTITRAHLEHGSKSKVQRQLEIEYAGYVPGFRDFVKDDERQIVAGMVDIAKQVAFLSNNVPVANGWRMQLGVTNERKYDFVRQISSTTKQLEFNPELLFAETVAAKEKHKVEK
ncbi:hypothetical protein HY485_01980 [Candidatus Woesearchaeota archaeon]|nr:hypothetical protein [Candidatus Woesearchaeota archaeon]